MSLLSRVSSDVKAVLTEAQDEARRLGHGYIGTEHLLIALLDRATSPGVAEVRRQGLVAGVVRRTAVEVFEATENAAPYVPDEESLAAVGVDLREVRKRVEAEFGAGSMPMRMGAPPFTPRAKDAVEAAVAIADGAGRGVAGEDDLLLGILGDEGSVGSRSLRALAGVDTVERAARRDIDR